jgi:hypothetical protein
VPGWLQLIVGLHWVCFCVCGGGGFMYCCTQPEDMAALMIELN